MLETTRTPQLLLMALTACMLTAPSLAFAQDSDNKAKESKTSASVGVIHEKKGGQERQKLHVDINGGDRDSSWSGGASYDPQSGDTTVRGEYTIDF